MKIFVHVLSLVFSLALVFMLCIGTLTASASSELWVYDGISDPTDYDYSFAIVGDTQKLVCHYANKLVWERGDQDEINYKYYYDVHEYPANDTFVKVYDYIVNNADGKNIVHVFGLGDITERASVWDWVQKGCPYAPDEEFSIAVEQFERMKDAGLDFSLVRGNHESWDSYNKYLGTGTESSALNYAGMVDEVYVHPNGTEDYTNTIHYFSAGDLDYMVVTLDYGASDAVFNWASERIEANPYKNVIITTHAYMYRDGTTLDANDAAPPSCDTDNIVYDKSNINNGDDMWNKLVSRHPNIVLAMSGHDPTDDIVMSQWEGVNGNVVTNMLIDPQGMDKYYFQDGCAGAVAMFYFSDGGKTVDVRYWSTARNCYIKTKNQFKFTINTIDADYTVVNRGIAELPAVDNLTLQNYAKVRELLDIYSNMSETNKAKVTNADKLTQAVARIDELAPSTQYTITWNVDGETSTSSVSYGDIPTYTGSAYKYGYEFIGWSTEANGTVSAPTFATENKTYYAVFSDVSVWDGFIPAISGSDTASTLFEGAGTKDNPYLIQSASDLAELSALTKGKNYGNSSLYFKQTIDIDLRAGNWQPICTDIEFPDNKWTQWYAFAANYDGDNHTIYLNESSMKFSFGLFGALSGSVSNLVIDGSIRATGYTGALVGQAQNGAVITNVINKADITANGNQVGGLVGHILDQATITITNCKNEGNIVSSGARFVGGIAGGGYASVKISGSANEGNVTGATEVGGIIGELWLNGETVNCTNTGVITAGSTVATGNVGTQSSFAGKLIGKSNRTHNVTWIVDGQPSTTSVAYADAPIFGRTPTKNATEEYSYVFAGWATSISGEPVAEDDLPVVTQDATYYAIFTEEIVDDPNEPNDPDDSGDSNDSDEPNDSNDPIEPPAQDVEETEELGFFAKIWKAIVDFFRRLFGLE